MLRSVEWDRQIRRDLPDTGSLFEMRMFMLFFERAYFRSLDFSLGREISSAGKFDDLVFKYAEDGKKIHRFLQVKYIHDEKRKIDSQALSVNEGAQDFVLKHKFSLGRYFNSYVKIKKSLDNEENSVLKDVIIFTNIDLDISDLRRVGLKAKRKYDNFLDFTVPGKEPALYQLEISEQSEVYKALKSRSEMFSLADELLAYAFKKIRRVKVFRRDKTSTLTSYYRALFQEILCPDGGKGKIKFCSKFIKGDSHLSKDASQFRDVFLRVASFKWDIFKEPEFWDLVKKIELNQFDFKGEPTHDRLPTNEVCDEDIKCFFKNLVFAVNQPDCEQLMDIIRGEDLRKSLNLGNTSFIVASLETYILRWIYETGGGEGWISIELCKEFFEAAVKHVSSIEVVGITFAYREGLKNYEIEFEREKREIEFLTCFLGDASQSQVLIINAEETVLTSIKVYSSLKELIDYESNDSNIFIEAQQMKKAEVRKKIIQVFKTTCNMLILEFRKRENENTSVMLETYDQLIEVLEQDSKKKVIFIARPTHTLNEISIAGCLRVTDHPACFSHLNAKSRKKVLEQEITIQGERVRFNKLIDSTDVEEIDNIIGSRVIVRLLKNREVRVGNPLLKSKGYDECCYINRVFYSNVTIKRDIEAHRQMSDFPDRLAFNESEFKQLCEKFPEINVHLLRRNSENDFEWLSSQGSILLLKRYKGERKTVRGSPIDPIKEADLLTSSKWRVIVICDTAGMGKSTVLTSLSKRIKKENPHIWVLRIDLNECTEVFEEELKRRLYQQKTKLDYEIVRDLLQRILVANKEIKTPFEEAVLDYCLKHEGKMVIFFDSFDEINPKHKQIVISLIKDLERHTKVEKICLATRPLMREELESELDIFSYSLGPFREKDQINFLTMFWQGRNPKENKERVRVFADKLIKTISDSIGGKEKELIGIPLQARMIAEIFEGKRLDSDMLLELEEKSTMTSEGLEEFYYSEQSEPFISKDFTFFSLYDHFIYKKYWNVYEEEKKKTNLGQYATKEDVKPLYENFRKEHQQMAVFSLLSNAVYEEVTLESEWEKVKVLVENVKSGKERRGIICEFIGDKPQFLYRSFAEYFFAEYMISFLSGTEKNSKWEYFFLGDVLVKDEYHNVRIFLNHEFLHKKFRIQKILECGLIIKELWEKNESSTNRWNEGIIQLATVENHIGLLHFIERCLKKHPKILKAMVNSKGNEKSIFYNTLQSGNLDACEWLIKKGIKIDNNERRMPLLHLAAECGSIKTVKYLLDKGVDINGTFETRSTVLHSAVKSGNLEMVKFLLENNAEINSKTTPGESLLHLALRTKNPEIFDFLLQSGADVTAKNDLGMTVLHLAAKLGNLQSVESLVGKGADVFAKTILGVTVLQSAVESNNVDIPKFLVKNGLIINNANVAMLLQKAEEHNNPEMIQYLLSQGATRATKIAKDRGGKTALFLAVQRGDFQTVEILIKNGVDVNNADDNGVTVLHLAAESKQLKVAKLLIENDADINSVSKSGKNVLRYAVDAESTELLTLLIKHKVDIKGVNSEKLLLLAAQSDGSLAVMKYLMEQRVDINARNDKEETVLHTAVRHKNLDVIKLLIQNGADVNARNKSGETVLHLAAESGVLETVRLILGRNSRIFWKTYASETVLHYAVKSGNLELVRFVADRHPEIDAKNVSGETALHLATKLGKLDIGKFLITQGADVNAKNHQDKTPMLLALHYRNRRFVELLAKSGADVNARNKQNETVLHLAAKSSNFAIMRYLVQKGAEVNAVDTWDITPLQLVVMLNDWDTTKFLIENHADVNHENKYGVTSLHLAVKSGYLKIVKLLLNHKADIRATDSKQLSVLHLAVKSGNLEMIKFLLSQGADLKAKNKDRETALQFAVEREDEEIVRYLVQNGADINSKNAYDETVLQIAEMSGNIDLVKSLRSRVRPFSLQSIRTNLRRVGTIRKARPWSLPQT